MNPKKGFNPQFIVTWWQLQGYYQVEKPFPKVNTTAILTSSEDEIMKELYNWLHLNDKLARPKMEPRSDPRKPQDPSRHPQEPPKIVTPADYIKTIKKKEETIGRCVCCGKVAELVLFNDEDKLCYCELCVPCL